MGTSVGDKAVNVIAKVLRHRLKYVQRLVRVHA